MGQFFVRFGIFNPRTIEMIRLNVSMDGSTPYGSQKVKAPLRNSMHAKLLQKKNNRVHRLTWLAGLALLTGFQATKAQELVTFKALLNQANSHYPALKSARLEKRAAIEEVEASRRLYWPNVSAVVEGPTDEASVTTPSRTLQIEQTLWDAGSIKARVAESQSLADIQTLKVVLLQEEVHLQLANAWQNLVASSERMGVAEQTMERLKIYQQQMQRRVKAEASPSIDLELVNSRILQTQVENKAAQNNFQQAITRIEQYTGRGDVVAKNAKNARQLALVVPPNFEQMLAQADWRTVLEKHPAIGKAKAETAQNQARLNQKKAEAWPQLYARISQPLNHVAPSYSQGPTAFIGLRYATSAGFSNHVQAQALASRVASTEELIEAATTDLRQTLMVDQAEYVNAKARVHALEQSVQGADQVLASYQRQFQAGKKTWQDLLNAVRELTQNQYALADARASMQGAVHRLQIRTAQDVQ
jgi:outer membrane protein, adhesin transport system